MQVINREVVRLARVPTNELAAVQAQTDARPETGQSTISNQISEALND